MSYWLSSLNPDLYDHFFFVRYLQKLITIIVYKSRYGNVEYVGNNPVRLRIDEFDNFFYFLRSKPPSEADSSSKTPTPDSENRKQKYAEIIKTIHNIFYLDVYSKLSFG